MLICPIDYTRFHGLVRRNASEFAIKDTTSKSEQPFSTRNAPLMTILSWHTGDEILIAFLAAARWHLCFGRICKKKKSKFLGEITCIRNCSTEYGGTQLSVLDDLSFETAAPHSVNPYRSYSVQSP